MLTRLGRLCHRHRWPVLVLWLAAMVVGGLAAGPVFDGMSNSNQLNGTETGAAREALRAGSDAGDDLVVIVEGVDPAGAAVTAAVTLARADLAALPGVREVSDPLPAVDGRGFALRVTLDRFTDDDREEVAVEVASARLRQLGADAGPGAVTRLGGEAIMDGEVNDAVQADLSRAELGSLPLTLLVLVVVFGGVVAAGLPLLATLATVLGSFGVLLAFSRFVDLDSNVVTVVSMLGLGLSIDYGLLLIARYREELAAGRAPADAVAATWSTAGRTLLFSALTVAAALSGLLFIQVPRLQAMGAAGISATVVALLSALTLTAALIGATGRWIKPARPGRWLRRGRAEVSPRDAAAALAVRGARPEPGFFARLARHTQRRPVLMTVVAGVVLLAAGAPLLGATIRLPQLESLPHTIESVQVAEDLGSRYGQTVQPAVTVVARTDLAALDGWAARWAAEPIVARIDAARQVGPDLALLTIAVRGDSQSAQAQDLVERIRADRPAGVQSWVIGDAAVLLDLNQRIRDGLPAALLTVTVAMLLLLFLMTGSLVIPVKALVMNVVSLGATFGVLVAVFERGWLAGPLDTLTVGGLSPFVVVLVFAFGFGLSMDYEVFLLGRIKEYVDAGDANDDAVRKGLQRSGRLITSAALLMLIVFGFFAAARVGDLEQIGLGLFVAVLVDASIVRCVLVPATMTLLGHWNWWSPPALRRWHDRHGLREHQPSPLVEAPPLVGSAG
ncbi:MMPL family transporter [Micromonospora sp. NPDC047548]|uniref:MMPL family transporter n=1 Tax=Micromonospora sp. NPDC047548 TaxID=3155624 RepID=UPI0033E7C9EC